MVSGGAQGHRASVEIIGHDAYYLEAEQRSLEDCFIRHDQDTVCTGYRWLQSVLIRERAKVSLSRNGPKGNTYMESFNGHFEGNNGSLFLQARNLWELRKLLAEQIEYYTCRENTRTGIPPWAYIKQGVAFQSHHLSWRRLPPRMV